jgi:hypothetical protein
MNLRRLFRSTAWWALLASTLGGCQLRGAPSFVIAGSYIPGWMLCVLIGTVSAIVARSGFIASDLAHVVPFQLAACSAIGLCCGLLAWLLWFGQ